MSKRKNSFLSILGLIATAEVLSANVDTYGFDYNRPSVTPGYGCYGFDYNRPLATSGYGFFGYVDYLYMQPDLRLMWEISETLGLEGIQPVFSNTFKQTPFDWNSGFRIGAGYGFPCDGWAIRADWMHIDSKVKHRDSGNTADNIGTQVSPGIGLTSQPIAVTSGIDFSANLCYDDIKLYLSKEYYVGPCVLLTPFFGAKALFIHSYVQDDLTTSSFFKTETLYSYTENYRATTNFQALGLAAGLASAWNIYSGLFLYGEGEASLLASSFHIHQRDENQNPAFIPVLDIKDRFTEVNFTLDGAFGLRWIQPMSCNSYVLSAYVGWEGHYISDQNRLSIPNNAIYLPSKPLTIHGLVVGIGIDL